MKGCEAITSSGAYGKQRRSSTVQRRVQTQEPDAFNYRIRLRQSPRQQVPKSGMERLAGVTGGWFGFKLESRDAAKMQKRGGWQATNPSDVLLAKCFQE